MICGVYIHIQSNDTYTTTCTTSCMTIVNLTKKSNFNIKKKKQESYNNMYNKIFFKKKICIRSSTTTTNSAKNQICLIKEKKIPYLKK